MSIVKVASFSVSLDGFGAGPNQSLENPLGLGGPSLHEWVFKTKTFQQNVLGQNGGATGLDDDFAARGFQNIGAWILGRNMFSPSRGPWRDDSWIGWWGNNPPYHVPVFVLTHYARSPIEMEGGTTFYFITDGIESALKKAKDAAKTKDVRIGGGVATVREYLKANMIDEVHLAYSPVFLGSGESLFSGINLPKFGFNLIEKVLTENAVHIVLKK